MTRKDYETDRRRYPRGGQKPVARTDRRASTWSGKTAKAISTALAKDNPRFDREPASCAPVGSRFDLTPTHKGVTTL